MNAVKHGSLDHKAYVEVKRLITALVENMQNDMNRMYPTGYTEDGLKVTVSQYVPVHYMIQQAKLRMIKNVTYSRVARLLKLGLLQSRNSDGQGLEVKLTYPQ